MINVATVCDKMPWFVFLLMGGGRAVGDICLVREHQETNYIYFAVELY